jgi:SlyX protein
MPDNAHDLIARLEELETRFAFQEHAMQELSQAYADQQRRIDVLEKAVRELREQLELVLPSLVADESEETPPPHY